MNGILGPWSPERYDEEGPPDDHSSPSPKPGEPTICEHLGFLADVCVRRVRHSEDSPAMSFVADVRVNCADCGAPFAFVGVPCGMRYSEPRVSPDHLELRAPITPEGVVPIMPPVQGFDIHTGARQ